jgi:hypothetical protein
MTNREPDLRILGASDGYGHALVHLRATLISPLVGRYSPGIHPRHVKKLAAREAKLKPLRELEAWLIEQHQKCRDTFEQQRIAAEQVKESDK